MLQTACLGQSLHRGEIDLCGTYWGKDKEGEVTCLSRGAVVLRLNRWKIVKNYLLIWRSQNVV
jgi:hypothetical protein